MTPSVAEMRSFEIIWQALPVISKGLKKKWKIQTGGVVNDYGIPRVWGR